MASYENQHLSLDELIERSSNERGATILIPDLQRPYVWTPGQVVLLVDSLIRGWPFGTLLLWKVHHSDLSNIPSRPFWRLVDRTDEEHGEIVSQKNPPAEFHMVLDGQQRLQSLLLAFGGDGWGFKMADSEWREEIEGKKAKGSKSGDHWSIGNLSLDLPTFVSQYQNAKNSLWGVDYRQVLKWVVNDPTRGLSPTGRPSTYKNALDSTTAPEGKGRFIRISRLWQTAQPNPSLREAQFRGMVTPVLDQHGVDAETQKQLGQPLGELLAILSELKRRQVSFLELAPFNDQITTRDDYNDSIVNIFTRLNTAGRTLTREEITFAWLKTGWDNQSTAGKTAIQCVAEFGQSLGDADIELTNDEIVGALSFVWAVCSNDGALLSNRDLLRGDTIRPMASNISKNWEIITDSCIGTASSVSARGLEYGVHFQSLNALVVLWAWIYLMDEWLMARSLTATVKDAAIKRKEALLQEFADRWLLCSQWAEVWTQGGGKSLSAFARQLSDDRKRITSATTHDSVLSILRETMQSWLKNFEFDAINNIRTLRVQRRGQVRDYYAPLWIWHRLDADRWNSSRITLQHQKAVKAKSDVDHVASVKLLEEHFGYLKAIELDQLGGREGVEALFNNIGNAFLMSKTFNISKMKKPLSEFLGQVHEFSSGQVKEEDWTKSLNFELAHMMPNAATISEFADSVKKRETHIKDDLAAFIAGTKSRADLQ